jgi:hypothetical protein
MSQVQAKCWTCHDKFIYSFDEDKSQKKDAIQKVCYVCLYATCCSKAACQLKTKKLEPFQFVTIVQAYDTVLEWCCSACIKDVLFPCQCGRWCRSETGVNICLNCGIKACRACVPTLSCGYCGLLGCLCRSCLFDPAKRKKNKIEDKTWAAPPLHLSWIETNSGVFEEKDINESYILYTVCDRDYRPPCTTCGDNSLPMDYEFYLRRQCSECRLYFCVKNTFCGLDLCRACMLKHQNKFIWHDSDSGWLVRRSNSNPVSCWICSSITKLTCVACCDCSKQNLPESKRVKHCESKSIYLCAAHVTASKTEFLLQQFFAQCGLCHLRFQYDNRHFMFCAECTTMGPCWGCEPTVKWLVPADNFTERSCKSCCNTRIHCMNQVLGPFVPDDLLQICFLYLYLSLDFLTQSSN